MNRKILLCFAWIGGAVLIGFLLCFFTLSYRTRLLMEKVNKTIAKSAGIRIEKPLGPKDSLSSVLGGSWFNVAGSSDKAFVFSMMHNGVAAACTAIVDTNGKVKAIIPLGGNAGQITGELPLPIYRFYADRIERDIQNRDVKKGVKR